jgi:hypothetical protein
MNKAQQEESDEEEIKVLWKKSFHQHSQQIFTLSNKIL